MAEIDDQQPGRSQGERVELTDKARSQLEQFRVAHETQVLTILFSDLVGSMQQQTDLGNVRAAALVQEHRTVFRKTLDGFDGHEVETAGDSFLAVFARPSEGVKFALHMQAAMRKARNETPDFPSVRVGIHQGQVVVERHADGSKPMDIYGIQVSTAARIMDLAKGGQILCSRAVFDDARAILRGEDLEGLRQIGWRNHGPYRFKEVKDSHEVCEVGEEGLAPLEAPPASGKSWPADQKEVPGWRPAVGVVVPESNWTLEERLGKEGSTPQGQPQYRGQFGEVWRARNVSDKSQQVFKFCFKREHVPALKREAVLLKSLQKHRHPNLVEVYEVTVGPRPPYYLKMEYVEGPSLEQWLLTDPPIAEQLEIVAQVADALDTVHAAGIFHRDIKPSNILLTHREDGTLQAKLTDFGLGAAEDPELLRSIYVSRVEGVAGTWDYMAPELRDGRKAGPQSDLYSLGMTLYQLVAGNLRLPLLVDWERMIPCELLQEHIRKCLQPKPQDRWARAADLAQALRTHDQCLRERQLAREKEQERQRLEREREELEREREEQRRRAKRLRTIVGFAASAIVTIVTVIVAVILIRGAKEETGAWKDQALAQKGEGEENKGVGSKGGDTKVVDLASFWAADFRILRDLRTRTLKVPDQYEASAQYEARVGAFVDFGPSKHLARFGLWSLHRFSPPPLNTFRGHTGFVMAVTVSPDGKTAVTGGIDEQMIVWDLMVGRAERDPIELPGIVTALAFSNKGDFIIAGLDKGGIIYINIKTDPWQIEPRKYEGATGLAWNIAISPDDRLVAACAKGRVNLWDVGGGKPRKSSDLMTYEKDKNGRVPQLLSVEFSPDGKQIVAGALSRQEVRIWEVASGRRVAIVDGIRFAAYAPDGRSVLTVDEEGDGMVLWDHRAKLPKRLRSFSGHTKLITSMAFSPDGCLLLSGGEDGTVRLWDVRTGKEVRTLYIGHQDWVWHVAWHPNGRLALSVGKDGLVNLWDLGIQPHAFVVDTKGLLAQFPRSKTEDKSPDVGKAPTIAAALPSSPDAREDFSRLRRYGYFLTHPKNKYGKIKGLSRLSKDVQTLQGSPKAPAALKTLGEWYAFRGQWKWATDILKRAREEGAQDVSPLMLARCYRRQENLTVARAEFQRAQKHGEFNSDREGASVPAELYFKLCLRGLSRSYETYSLSDVPLPLKKLSAEGVEAILGSYRKLLEGWSGHPDNVQVRQWMEIVAACHSELGDLARPSDGSRAPDAAKAMEAYGKALDIRERLVKMDRFNDRWQKQLIDTHLRIADVQSQQNKPDAAIGECQKARDRCQALVDADPDNFAKQRHLGEIHEQMLGILRRHGKTKEAAEAAAKEKNKK